MLLLILILKMHTPLRFIKKKNSDVKQLFEIIYSAVLIKNWTILFFLATLHLLTVLHISIR